MKIRFHLLPNPSHSIPLTLHTQGSRSLTPLPTTTPPAPTSTTGPTYILLPHTAQYPTAPTMAPPYTTTLQFMSSGLGGGSATGGKKEKKRPTRE